MAFLNRACQRARSVAILLSQYVTFALTDDRREILQLLNHLHRKAPALLHHGQPVTLPLESSNLTSEPSGPRNRLRSAYVVELRSAETDEDSTIPRHTRNNWTAGFGEECSDASSCSVERSAIPPDSQALLLGERRPTKRTTGQQMGKARIHTFDVALMPRVNTSVLVDATPAPQRLVEGSANTFLAPADAHIPIREAAHGLSSPDMETPREDMYKHASFHHLFSERKTVYRGLQDVDMAQPSVPRAALQPAQVVEFLLYPTQGDLEEETSAPPEKGSATETIKGELLSEQTDESQDTEHHPMMEKPLLRRGAPSRHPPVVAFEEDFSQRFPRRHRVPRRRAARIQVARHSRQKILSEESAQQSSSRPHPPGSFQPQHPLENEFGNMYRRRLTAVDWRIERPLTSTTLDGLQEAKRHLAFLLESNSARHAGMNMAPQAQENQRAENETRAKAESTFERKRVLKASRNKRFRSDGTKKGEAKSLGQAYQRYLREEAQALGHKPGLWQNMPLKNVLIVGGLLLLGQPIFALHAMAFTLVDQLMHLDASLERQTVMHLRARRRLVKQYLKDAQKESEELNAAAPKDAPGEGAQERVRANPTTYNVFDTNVLKFLDPTKVLPD